MKRIFKKKAIATTLAIILTVGSIGTPFWSVNQKEQKIMAATISTKASQNAIPNQTVSDLKLSGTLSKGKQKLYEAASSAGKKVTVDGKDITLAKDTKVTIISQKVKSGTVWYKITFLKNNNTITGYLPSSAVTLKLNDSVKAKINSTKKVKVRTRAGNKKAYLKQNGATVSLKKATKVDIKKETKADNKKWFQITFTYNKKKLKGYVEANTLIFVKETSKAAVTATPYICITKAPIVTEKPDTTPTVCITKAPIVMEKPDTTLTVTEAPSVTPGYVTGAPTSTPIVTEAPSITPGCVTGAPTPTPIVTEAPSITPGCVTGAPTPTPIVTESPSATPGCVTGAPTPTPIVTENPTPTPNNFEEEAVLELAEKIETAMECSKDQATYIVQNIQELNLNIVGNVKELTCDYNSLFDMYRLEIKTTDGDQYSLIFYGLGYINHIYKNGEPIYGNWWCGTPLLMRQYEVAKTIMDLLNCDNSKADDLISTVNTTQRGTMYNMKKIDYCFDTDLNAHALRIETNSEKIYIVYLDELYTVKAIQKDSLEGEVIYGELENRPVPTEPALQLSYEEGVNQFGFQIFEELSKESTDANTFLSPYSITSVLLMLANGAGSDTKTEIEQTLGVDDLEQWNESAKSFLNREAEGNVTLNVSNSIWTDKSLIFSDIIERQYFGELMTNYNAEKKIVDFTDEKTVDEINEFVSDKTEKMIDPFLDEIPKDTKIALLNVLYLNAAWTSPFYSECTYSAQFTNADGTKNIVDMMSKTNTSLKYIEKSGLQAVELPYGNGNLAMDVILAADSGISTLEAFEKLSDTEKQEFLTGLSKEKGTMINKLEIPKFKMEYGTKELKSTLETLGIKEAFQETADFNAMNPDDESFYVTTVQHKAIIEVCEEGTKAAAATMAALAPTCTEPGEEVINFIANRPFVFVIKDVKTGMVLFVGNVNTLTDANKLENEPINH